MTYQTITNQILEVISESTKIINDIWEAKEVIKKDNSKKQEIIDKLEKIKNGWYIKCQNILIDNELILEQEEFINYPGSAFRTSGLNSEMSNVLNFMKNRKSLLIDFAKNIESKQDKEVVLLSIDDFDNFEEVREIKASEVIDFSKDCFLEDDVENAFLEKLEESYKEPDGGSETRDLFSDRIIYKGKRLATVFIFKGRGQPGELTIKRTGSTGNQLLKLAKNNSAQCFVVQHTNKINPDVREALQDHILQNTRLSKIYICFIDGTDTARFLKSVEKDLEELKNKR